MTLLSEDMTKAALLKLFQEKFGPYADMLPPRYSEDLKADMIKLAGELSQKAPQVFTCGKHGYYEEAAFCPGCVEEAAQGPVKDTCYLHGSYITSSMGCPKCAKLVFSSEWRGE